MPAGQGTAAELTDDDRLVVGHLPGHLGGYVHVAIPSHILVEAHHIHILVHVVAQLVVEVLGRGHLHGHGDQAAAVHLAGIAGQAAQELVARLAVRCLVGNAPDDDGSAVLVPVDHVVQLALGVGVGLLVGPVDGPVDRNLVPHHDTHLLGLAHLQFAVRIVGQTHKVAVQLLGPSQQGAALLQVACASLCEGGLLVDGHTAQEDGLPVQHNLLPLRLDAAESYPVLHGLLTQRQGHVVELRTLGAPQFGLRLDGEFGAPLVIGHHLEVHLQFGDADGHPFPGLPTVQLHPSGQVLPVLLVELQAVVLDVGLAHLRQQHIARDAAIVPPVVDVGRYLTAVALVVHLHDDVVLSRLQGRGDVVVEGGESAHVPPHLLSVDVDDGFVVHRSEVEHRASSRLGLVVEGAAQPHRPFVEEEPAVLRVPVAGDGHLRTGVEVILHQVYFRALVGVAEESVAVFPHAVVVEPAFLHIHDVVPLSVQRRGVGAAIDVVHQRYLLCLQGQAAACSQA